MKYLNKILYLFVVSAILTSCNRDVIDANLNHANTLFFSSSDGSLFVEEGAANTFDIVVAATAVANSDIPYTISIDDSSTAVEGVDFTMNFMETQLPTGDIVTSFGIAADFDNAEIAGKTVVFNLTSESSNVATSNQFTLNLIKLCPLEAPFTGAYNISFVTLGLYDTPTFTEGTVTLNVGATQLDRVFSQTPYPAFGAFPAVDFAFSLVCGNVIVPGGQVTGVGCGGVSTTLGPAAITGSFDTTDDSVIQVIYLDDEGGASCGADGDVTAEMTLTKI